MPPWEDPTEEPRGEECNQVTWEFRGLRTLWGYRALRRAATRFYPLVSTGQGCIPDDRENARYLGFHMTTFDWQAFLFFLN